MSSPTVVAGSHRVIAQPFIVSMEVSSGAGIRTVSIFLITAAVLVLGAIAPSFAAWESIYRSLRWLPVFGIYPLFLAMAATHGVRPAAAAWISFAALGLLLELVADAFLPPDKRSPFLRTLRNAALLWPLTIPGATESMLVRFGLVGPPPEMKLPDLPRGAALLSLADDEMLIAAHGLLSAQPLLTSEETTVLFAESFNREVHGGGFLQWFCNTDASAHDTIESLRTVRAERTARLLEHALEAASRTPWTAAQSPTERNHALQPAESTLRALDDEFFALERQEDLTSLIARFLRKHRAQCPALDSAEDVGPTEDLDRE